MDSPATESLAEGRFKLLGVIGEGGMATVYRAFDQRLQRPRAIKVLSPALAMRPSLRRRFLSEAQTMATLEESRVVRVFDMGEDGDRVYIVMELVEGGSLVDRVRDGGPLPPRMAAEVVQQLCESLHVAHLSGVIHRDIKPHNILLTRTGEIRVTDFGIAQVQAEDGDGMTRTGAVMGTWGFMAPEQKSNAKAVDARADVYSAGATLWALLRDDTPPELFMADNEPDMMAFICEELTEVIRRATRYRREERFPTALDMAEALRAIIPMLPPDPAETPPLVANPQPRFGRSIESTLVELRNPSSPPPSRSPEATPPAARVGAATMGTIAPEVGELRPSLAEVKLGSGATFAVDPEPAYVRKARRRRWIAPVVVGVISAAAAASWVVSHREPVTTKPARVDAVPVVEPVAAPPTPPPAEPVATPAEPTASPAPAEPVPVASEPPAEPAKPVAKAEPKAKSTKTTSTTTVAAQSAPPVEAAPAPGKITHSPPPPAKLGEAVTFKAAIGGEWKLTLRYRPAGGGAFQQKSMSGEGGVYSATVRVTDDLAGGIEYFIEADDGTTKIREGAPTKLLKVKVG